MHARPPIRRYRFLLGLPLCLALSGASTRARDTASPRSATAPPSTDSVPLAPGAAAPAPFSDPCASWLEFTAAVERGETGALADFSYAGYHRGERAIPDALAPVLDVTDFGAIPDDGRSDLDALRRAFAAADERAPVVLSFPPGRLRLGEADGPAIEPLRLHSSGVVLRGSGAEGERASELFLPRHLDATDPEKMWTTPYALQIGPAQPTTEELGRLVRFAARGSFELVLESDTPPAAGDVLRLKSRTPAANARYLGELPVEPEWTRMIESGVDIQHLHRARDVRRLTPEEVRALESGDANEARSSNEAGDTNENTRANRDRHASAFGGARDSAGVLASRDPHAAGETNARAAHDASPRDPARTDAPALWLVRLHEPLRVDVVPSDGPTLWRRTKLFEIGIEDLAFVGAWHQPFRHHLDAIHDGGWSLLQLSDCVDSWIRRCRFTDLNRPWVLTRCLNVSVLDSRTTGNKGHHATGLSTASHCLVAFYRDEAGHHHGPGVQARCVGNVLHEVDWTPDTCFEAHANYPMVTLFDQCAGGLLYGRWGGDRRGLPNHLGELVMWNFEQLGEPVENYDFWRARRVSVHGRVLPPILVGWHGEGAAGTSFESAHVARNESFGRPVEPASLWRAQLERRLGELPSWLRER